MAHPRMYRDDDPYLSRLRAVCLALPESVEVEAWGRPTFRAGKKIFAVFTGDPDESFAGAGDRIRPNDARDTKLDTKPLG